MMNLSEWLTSVELGLIYGFVALGVYLTFRVMNFSDMTCEGSFSLGGIMAGVVTRAGWSGEWSLLAAILAGSLAGVCTGWLHIRIKISDLLSGILMTSMLYAINLRLMSDVPNISLAPETLFLSQGGLTKLLVITGGLLIFFYGLLVTDFGLALRSLGVNPTLARHSGVGLLPMTFWGLALSNGCAALGGALLCQSQGFADIGSGTGSLVFGLAGVIIGERIFPSRHLGVQIFSCLLGSVFYRLCVGLALHADFLGLRSSDLNLITGCMIIGFMALKKERRG